MRLTDASDEIRQAVLDGIALAGEHANDCDLLAVTVTLVIVDPDAEVRVVTASWPSVG